jgi:pyridoxamine 5'-phosphate oxidase
VTGSPTPIDPIAEFRALQARAAAAEPEGATVAILATAGGDGQPSARAVLVKAVGPLGFDFFTNHASRKARELAANPHAALCFFWPSVQQQVQVEGTARRLSDQEADAYFATRPRGSQLGAWASRQSNVLDARATLERRYAESERRFAGAAVPRPPFWGGYRLAPARIEFWQGMENRLHDRRLFERAGDGWREARLYP